MRAAQMAKERRSNVIRQLAVVLAVVVVVALVAVAVIYSQNHAKVTGSAPPGVNSAGGITVGDSSAPVKVSMVEDFQCPVCRRFESENRKVLDGYAKSNKVQLEYRPIAFLDQSSTTNYSSRALNAAACFQELDANDWYKFHNLLYANQPEEGSAGLPDSKLISMAESAGAPSSIAQCVKHDKYGDWVSKTTKTTTGKSWFQGTPTVFVNGKPLPNALAPGALKKAVDGAVAKAGK